MSLVSSVETLTPAGLQSAAALRGRRLAAAALNLATYLGLLAWLASILFCTPPDG